METKILQKLKETFLVKFLHQQFLLIQGDQKVSMLLMITIQKSGAQRLLDHSVFFKQIQVFFIV